MPSLTRFFLYQTATGFGLAAIFVALLLWFDIGRLGYLVTNSDSGLLAVFLLWTFNGSVFAAAQFGIALMRLGAEDEGGSGTRTRHDGFTPAPVLAAAPKVRRQI